jgi:hypothetical protein
MRPTSIDFSRRIWLLVSDNWKEWVRGRKKVVLGDRFLSAAVQSLGQRTTASLSWLRALPGELAQTMWSDKSRPRL